MAQGVTRRGHANTQAVVQVTIDPAQVAAAVDTAVAAATLVLQATLVHEVRPQAIVDRAPGVTRAFLRTPWMWEARSVGRVLYLASLRG
jgi:hypothetical protein